jgi:hypothetical protein
MAFAFAWQVYPQDVARAASPDAPEARANHRVLILVDEPGDPFMDRIGLEVTSVGGLDVIMRPPVGSLDADARAEHAEVAIRKLASGLGVEVWMADATSGRSLLRHLIVDESPAGPDQSLIALQTAEFLRTSFFPRHETASPAVAAPPPTAGATASPPPEALGADRVQVGVGYLHSAGGVSPALQAWLSYQHVWRRGLGVVLDVSAPLLRGNLSGPQGTAEVGAVVAGAGLLARFESEGGRMFVAAEVGGAFASVLVTGHPVANLVGSSPSASTGLAYLRLDGGVAPLRWLGLGVAAILATTTTRVRIEFAGNRVGNWGVPIVGGFAYAEIGW